MLSLTEWRENFSANPESNKPVLHDPGNGDAAVTLMKQEPEFWVKLGDLANHNAQEMSELLGTPVEQISAWYDRIRYAIRQAEEIKAEKQPEKMTRTGLGK